MKKVLVINADASARAYLDDLLQCFGYRADWAGSASAVATLLETNQYGAAILDESMNFCHGTFVRWLRERHGLKVILLVDPFAGPGLANVLKIAKPVSASQLKGLLDRLVSENRANETLTGDGIRGGHHGQGIDEPGESL